MQLLEKDSLGFEDDKFKPDFIFSDNENKIFIKVINDGEVNERSALLSSVMMAVSFLKKANIVYLLLPKLYASILDGRIFYNYGIGLLTYSDKDPVQEVIKPKVFSHNPEGKTIELSSEILNEIINLKNRVFTLEQDITILKDELNELRIKKTNLEISPNNQESKMPLIQIDGNMPEFMRDNPWIEILSKRGRIDNN